MRVSPINNTTAFKATLPPNIKRTQDNGYYDYWPTLYKYCAENKAMYLFEKLLNKLTNNNIDGYLALDTQTDSTGFDEVNFRYYKNLEDYKKLNFGNAEVTVFEDNSDFLKTLTLKDHRLVDRMTCTTAKEPLAKGVLSILEKVLEPKTLQHKTLFENAPRLTDAEMYLKKFRAKI